MLSTEMHQNPALREKLEEIVRNNDRALASAAARMNADLARSLRVSRFLTVLALAVCALVVFVVHHQGNTITTQQQLIRQLFQDNQELFQYRLKNPPMEQRGAEQPTKNTPASGAEKNPALRADGCRNGVCV